MISRNCSCCAVRRTTSFNGFPTSCGNCRKTNLLASEADEKVYNIINLIYHSRNYEGTSKDYEFSRRTMDEHWESGYNDAVRTLRHPEVLQRPENHDGVFTFDLARDGRE